MCRATDGCARSALGKVQNLGSESTLLPPYEKPSFQHIPNQIQSVRHVNPHGFMALKGLLGLVEPLDSHVATSLNALCQSSGPASVP